MRLVTIRTETGTTAGRVDGDAVVELAWPDVGALLADGRPLEELATADGPRRPYDPNALAPVVPRPPKMWCVGLNYASHVAEMGHDLPAHPTLFAKFPIALIGARDPITVPRGTEQLDWEVELGLVIGRPGRHVAASDALDHVAGYTVVNDVTARDWQRRTGQFLQGKTFEGTCPVGPELVTPDELPPGARGLQVECVVDGEVVQQAATDDLIFDVAALVSYVSEIASLEPGDVIATGTPGGVGAGRTPPLFLQPGDAVRTAIEGVGELVNTCQKEPGT